MKFGMRTPSLKRSISARTTGRAKRAIKKALIPGYGKKDGGHQESKEGCLQQDLQKDNIQPF